MTRTDKLLDIGLRCPCGGEIRATYKPTVGTYIRCSRCASITTEGLPINALTAWFVLTGGPIPGEIHPPNDLECPGTSICVLSKGHLIYWESKPSRWIHIPSNWPTNDPDEGWYFLDRNPEIIRPWLEEEIDE